MVMTSMVISIGLTVVILLLSLLTISKGYGFKHTVDPKPDTDPEERVEFEENAK